MTKDEEQLNLLSVLYYVVGGFSVLFALIPIIHLVIGIMMLSGNFPISDTGQPAPPFLAWFFICLAIVLMLFGAALAVLLIMAGKFIKRRKHYNFCFISAIVACLFMPIGTILGIFTIIVLSRESVKLLFRVPQPSAAL